jgi:hypothetical protein
MSLIEQLYDEKSVGLIRAIYAEDLSSRQSLFQAFGQKILEKQETFLIAKPLDILTLICMTASFAESPEESQEVAIIFFKRIGDINPLPYISEDRGLILAEKTLVSLSLYPKAMEKRWKYKGAPSPNFYREVSKLIFKKNEKHSIVRNYEKWESFFSEIFV